MFGFSFSKCANKSIVSPFPKSKINFFIYFCHFPYYMSLLWSVYLKWYSQISYKYDIDNER